MDRVPVVNRALYSGGVRGGEEEEEEEEEQEEAMDASLFVPNLFLFTEFFFSVFPKNSPPTFFFNGRSNDNTLFESHDKHFKRRTHQTIMEQNQHLSKVYAHKLIESPGKTFSFLSARSQTPKERTQ